MNEYTFKLTQQEIQVVITALGKLPLEMSYATFNKIDVQLKNQALPQDHSDKEL